MTIDANTYHAEGASPNLRYFRIWAGLLFGITLILGPLTVFTFGALSFIALFALWLREFNKTKPQALDRLNGIVLLTSAVWFLLNLVIEIYQLCSPAEQDAQLYLPLIALASIYPPLIMHSSYLEHRPYIGPSRFWKVSYFIVYPISAAFSLSTLLRGPALVRQSMERFYAEIQIPMFLLFIVAAGYGIAISIKSRKPVSCRQRNYPRWNLAMILATFLIFLITLVAIFVGTEIGSFGNAFLMNISLISRSLPLLFFFIGTYYQNRFTFFDVFIKRGTFFFLLLVLLEGYFSLAAPRIDRFGVAGMRPWLYALTLLPLLLFLPWAYRKLEKWLDQAWLGRSFATVDAVKYFLSGLQNATSEETLRHLSEERLSEVFQADVAIELDSVEGNQARPIEVVLQVPVPSHGPRIGVLHLGRRANDTPYFSADRALLSSLADVFCSILENVRLLEKKQEQEKREKDLLLHASRSELKALRAQINPHFLFNALNAIAGLIHKDPAKAEETVEELAEVFRYTLKRSEKDTGRLAEELDFVRSYLEVEQARFGDRLQVRLDTDPAANDAEVPTMLVQTLVENAIKHGVAAVRGQGVIEICARRSGDCLLLQVMDNGPGFQPGATEVNRRDSSGYGLKNLRQRLLLHYGGSARVDIRREEERQMTVVSIELPVSAPVMPGEGPQS